MADDEKSSNEEPLSTAFRYSVECNDVNNIDVNSSSSSCMTLSFTHKKSRQIYATTMSVADCKELIEKVPMMPISGLVKLLSDALTESKKTERLAVKWQLANNAELLQIDVIRKSADEYVPDMVFTLKLTAKSMDPVDKLQIRIEELEHTVQTLQQEMAQKNEALRGAVFSNADTGQLSNGSREVLQLELPQKAGKFVLRYSVEMYATSNCSWWIYYAFTMGGTRLAPKGGGVYLPTNTNSSYPLPVSQSVVVTLNGTENAQQRKVALTITSTDQTYQAGMKNACIEYYEIPN